MLKDRETLQNERKGLVRLATSSSDRRNKTHHNSSDPDDEIIELLDRMVLFLDGEYGAVNAIFSSIIDDCIKRNVQIEFVKLAAACSFMQQPNDLMTSFRTLKNLITRHEYRRKIVDKQLLPASLSEMEDIFKRNSMQNASIKTFIHFFAKLRELLSAAYSVQSVIKGWEKAGIYPFNLHVILSKHPGYEVLSKNEEDFDKIAYSVDILSVMAYEEGYIREEDMRALLGDLLLPEVQYAKDYELLPFNWVRTLWLNNENIRKMRRERIVQQQQATLTSAVRAKSRQTAQQPKILKKKVQKSVNSMNAAQAVTVEEGNPNTPASNKKKRKSTKYCIDANCFVEISIHCIEELGEKQWHICPNCEMIFCNSCTNEYECHFPICRERLNKMIDDALTKNPSKKKKT
jgi:hypothetical protein